MTIFDMLLIMFLGAIVIIVGLFLITRNAFERPQSEQEKLIAFDAKTRQIAERLKTDMQTRMDNSNHYLETKIALQERLAKERQEITKPIDMSDLEAALEDEDGTDPPNAPPSDFELLAIEYLESREDL